MQFKNNINHTNGETLAGTSEAYPVFLVRDLKALVVVSDITGGTVSFEYSLTDPLEAARDEIVWIASTSVGLATGGGLTFTAPVQYIRIVASVPAVSYKLNIRSDRF